MSYFLNIAYLCILVVASPWLLFSAIWQGKYREGFAAKLLGFVPIRKRDRPCVWFHAVSVGEANLLQTIVPKFEERFPGIECVISVTTKTAFEMAKEKFAPRTVFYCPLDFTWAVNRAMQRIRPELLVLVELELWPNLLRAAKRKGVKTAIVNGRLSENSFRGYGRIRSLIKPLLESIDLIAAQNETYAQRFEQLGARPECVHVTGSIKFDGASTDRDHPKARELASLAGFQSTDTIFLAGSTQHPEEQIALETFQKLRDRFPQLKLILVPRHPHRFDEVAKLLDSSGVHWQRRTKLDETSHDLPDDCPRVLLVDTIGELGSWWATAQVGFVGGSMGTRGGQNMIEPAAYGVAVSFGPHTKNFRDVVEMMSRHQAAVVVKDADDLESFVGRCLAEKNYAKSLGENARQLVQKQLGAIDRTLDLFSLMPTTQKNAA